MLIYGQDGLATGEGLVLSFLDGNFSESCITNFVFQNINGDTDYYIYDNKRYYSIVFVETTEDTLIYVQKIGQKKIVIGKNGHNLKIIGTLVRKDLELMLDKKVHLFLYVKVKSNWDKNPEYFKSLGLDYNV